MDSSVKNIDFEHLHLTFDDEWEADKLSDDEMKIPEETTQDEKTTWTDLNIESTDV
jgi:hypothetical protein